MASKKGRSRNSGAQIGKKLKTEPKMALSKKLKPEMLGQEVAYELWWKIFLDKTGKNMQRQEVATESRESKRDKEGQKA